METLLEKIHNTDRNPEVISVLNKIKELSKTSKEEYQNDMVKIISKVILMSRIKKSDRILIPCDTNTSLSITTTAGVGSCWYSGSTTPFSNIIEYKTKIFNSTAYDELKKYMTPDGIINLEKIKTILNKYEFKDIISSKAINLKKKIPLNNDEKNFILKKINSSYISIDIENSYGSNIEISFTDDCYTGFDFSYDAKTNNNYIISLALAEKYPTQIVDTINEYIEKFEKSNYMWANCRNDLRMEFAKYIVLDIM